VHALEASEAVKHACLILLVLGILWVLAPLLPFLMAVAMAVVFLALMVRLLLPP
jgi:hypothetical protein